MNAQEKIECCIAQAIRFLEKAQGQARYNDDRSELSSSLHCAMLEIHNAIEELGD